MASFLKKIKEITSKKIFIINFLLLYFIEKFLNIKKNIYTSLFFVFIVKENLRKNNIK